MASVIEMRGALGREAYRKQMIRLLEEYARVETEKLCLEQLMGIITRGQPSGVGINITCCEKDRFFGIAIDALHEMEGLIDWHPLEYLLVVLRAKHSWLA